MTTESFFEFAGCAPADCALVDCAVVDCAVAVDDGESGNCDKVYD